MNLEEARDASLVALSECWTELRGYVQAAQEDGDQVDPDDLLRYMDELRHRARTPLREAFAAIMAGPGNADGQPS